MPEHTIYVCLKSTDQFAIEREIADLARDFERRGASAETALAWARAESDVRCISIYGRESRSPNGAVN